HEVPVVIGKIVCSIKLLRSGVRPFHLQVECTDAQLAARVFRQAQRLSTQSSVTVAFVDINLVQNGVTTTVFNAEAERQNGIADWRTVGENEPHPAEVGVLQ